MAYTETIIYGSANGTAADAQEKRNYADAESKPDSMMAQAQELAQNPLTFPLALPLAILATLQKGGATGGAMAARRHSPRGALVQTMSSKELTNNNIFGAGGSN